MELEPVPTINETRAMIMSYTKIVRFDLAEKRNQKVLKEVKFEIGVKPDLAKVTESLAELRLEKLSMNSKINKQANAD